MNTHRILPLTLVALAVIAGCSTLPADNARLNDARRDYRAAQEDPATRDLAAVELRQAGDALARADESWTRKDDTPVVDHWAYLARQRVAIARETGQRKTAEQASKDAQAGRDQVRLAARTDEADAARRSAESAQRDAQASQQQAAASQRQTVDAQARSAELEAQLKEMNAKKTDRGLVVTIGDVLFETGNAQLRSDGMRNVEKLAGFLKRFPQRSAMVEGFTDSTGSEGYNQALSGRRADAVRAAIVDQGVDRSRIATHGYGEAYPVAANDSSSGRQLNRRVEIILSDDGGTIAPR